MNTDELRAACEAAGMMVQEKPIAPGWEAGIDGVGCRWWYDDDDPALPVFAASLLVARVREMSADAMDTYDDALVYEGGGPAWATDAQRIRAAMKVLEVES